MSNGFTYKGIHSSQYGIVKTVNNPLLPAVKTSYTSNRNRDGSDDFTLNSNNRFSFEDKVIEVTLQAKTNPNKMYDDLNNIKMWLVGKGNLVFDDEPDKIWVARCYDTIDFAPKLLSNYIEINISFRCEPFATSDINILDVELKANTSKTVELAGGSYYSFLKIAVIKGGGSGLLSALREPNSGCIFGDTAHNLYYNGNLDNLVIDSQYKHCYNSATNESLVKNWYGDFMELASGTNTITLNCAVAITLRLSWFKKYL